MFAKGNIVAKACTGFGEIRWENGIIENVTVSESIRRDEPWILPGFIDLHIHGSGDWSVENGCDGIRGMSAFLPSRGVTRFLPTYACAPHEELLDFIRNVRKIAAEKPCGTLVAGSHLEGPFLSEKFAGGMVREMIFPPNVKQTKEFLDAASGSLKIMTLAPEISGAMDVISMLHENGVTVSCGHSACPPEMLEDAVSAGVSEICHLFDCYELPESRDGVRQAALTDMVLIHDGLMKEIIMDGLHVPPGLIALSRRAAGADHIIAITDALQGAGLAEGHFMDCGHPYTIREGELARRDEDNTIVGSSLTMNRAFFNMVEKFGFSVEEAVLTLSENPAKQLKADRFTGSLQSGKCADITVMAPDNLTVLATYINGEKAFENI